MKSGVVEVFVTLVNVKPVLDFQLLIDATIAVRAVVADNPPRSAFGVVNAKLMVVLFQRLLGPYSAHLAVRALMSGSLSGVAQRASAMAASVAVSSVPFGVMPLFLWYFLSALSRPSSNVASSPLLAGSMGCHSGYSACSSVFGK